RFAVAYHFKPAPQAASIEGMVRQARAQARTAVQLGSMHPHWRVVLATGDHPAVRALAGAARAAGVGALAQRAAGAYDDKDPLRGTRRLAASVVRGLAYFEELDHVHREELDRAHRSGA
ncbi:MAG TPA: hypothetical protein VGD50_05795, partial [Candidatus Baltobacteraceae bacterium]